MTISYFSSVIKKHKIMRNLQVDDFIKVLSKGRLMSKRICDARILEFKEDKIKIIFIGYLNHLYPIDWIEHTDIRQ